MGYGNDHEAEKKFKFLEGNFSGGNTSNQEQ